MIFSGAPRHFRYFETPGESILRLYAYNERVQGLIGVHFDLQQIFLCVQVPRSADWSFPSPFQPTSPITSDGVGHLILVFRN